MKAAPKAKGVDAEEGDPMESYLKMNKDVGLAVSISDECRV